MEIKIVDERLAAIAENQREAMTLMEMFGGKMGKIPPTIELVRAERKHRYPYIVEGCERSFTSRQGIAMHKLRGHGNVWNTRSKGGQKRGKEEFEHSYCHKGFDSIAERDAHNEICKFRLKRLAKYRSVKSNVSPLEYSPMGQVNRFLEKII